MEGKSRGLCLAYASTRYFESFILLVLKDRRSSFSQSERFAAQLPLDRAAGLWLFSRKQVSPQKSRKFSKQSSMSTCRKMSKMCGAIYSTYSYTTYSYTPAQNQSNFQNNYKHVYPLLLAQSLVQLYVAVAPSAVPLKETNPFLGSSSGPQLISREYNNIY